MTNFIKYQNQNIEYKNYRFCYKCGKEFKLQDFPLNESGISSVVCKNCLENQNEKMKGGDNGTI